MTSRLSTFREQFGQSVPVATIADFPIDDLPNGYLFCDGAAVDRVVYARLFDKIGTTYGNGDGSTTFNIPDFRGYVRRGLSGTTDNDPDKAGRTDRGDGTTGNNVGTKQADHVILHQHTISNHVHDMRHTHQVLRYAQAVGLIGLSSANTGTTSFTSGKNLNETQSTNIEGSVTNVTLSNSESSSNIHSSGVNNAPSGSGNSAKTGAQEDASGNQNTSNVGGNETRMKNIYVKPAIKY